MSLKLFLKTAFIQSFVFLMRSECNFGSTLVNNRCVVAKQVNQFCNWDQECTHYDVNTICLNSRCSCKRDYKLNDQVQKCELQANKITEMLKNLAKNEFLSSLNDSLIPVFNGDKAMDFNNDFDIMNGSIEDTDDRKDCGLGLNRNDLTDKCEQRLIEVKAENILFLFTVMFVFCVLFIFILKRREQDFARTDALIQDLLTLQVLHYTTEHKEYDSDECERNQLPTYQEICQTSYVIDIDEELPTYEDAIKLSANKLTKV